MIAFRGGAHLKHTFKTKPVQSYSVRTQPDSGTVENTDELKYGTQNRNKSVSRGAVLKFTAQNF